MIDYELVVDSMLIEARAAMLDGEILELEPCQFSDCITHVMEKLRQAEKDAARYRWLNEQNKSVMSKVMVCNGWIDDSDDDVEYISDISSFIDEAMQCSK